MEYLVVDGYNVIGASVEYSRLKDDSLEDARYQLQEDLSEYSAYTGSKIIVVYDAHLSKGMAKKDNVGNLEIHFTKEGTTADEYIEKLISGLVREKYKVYVATSDFLEQRLIFGKGALRMSSRELLQEIKVMKERISDTIIQNETKPLRMKGKLNPEIAQIFEKWRRK